MEHLTDRQLLARIRRLREAWALSYDSNIEHEIESLLEEADERGLSGH